jgi:CRISPR-associated protein Cas5t
MSTTWVRVQAPFGAFRTFRASSYYNTMPTMPPSAAYGLVLNLAGIECRAALNSKATGKKSNLPKFDIAIGDINIAEVNVLYQQIHGYPVCSATGKDLVDKSNGSKYWISPVRKEFLSNLDIIIGIKNINQEIIEHINTNLKGESTRYGLPFLGDNNYLINQINILESPIEAYWYNKLPGNITESIKNTYRLTINIDRENNQKTNSALYYRINNKQSNPDEECWTTVS